MKPDNASSASSSAPTSPPRPALDVPPDHLTEAEYLAQQAENAKLALAGAWDQFKARLAQGAAPQAWAKQFPWVTVGAAAVAGFVAATTLIPSKEEQALKKLAAIERALNPHPPHPEKSNGDEKKEPKSALGSILHEVIAIARPALVSLIAAQVGGAALNPDPTQAPAPAPPKP